MEKEKLISPVNIIVALFIALLVISASVTATLFDRGAYARFQEKLDLPSLVGIGEEELLDNYNALIDYNSVFFTGPLTFPTLSMSDAGRIHFEEVKAIFSGFQVALIVSAVLVSVFCFLLIRRRRFRFLALGGIFALLIPALVFGVMAAVGWDRFFVLFHQMFFNNEFWVFDSSSDPVILILPDAYFLNCLIRIIAGIVISSALLITGSALPKHFHK